MFGKDAVKNLINVNSINEKIANRATKKNEKVLEGMKKTYLEKIQTTYTNMSAVIDDGLKRSYNRSLVAFDNYDLEDLNVSIVVSVSFAIQNISGLSAFIKIVEDYSKEYNIEFIDGNFTRTVKADFDFLAWIKGLRDMFVAIDPLNERNNILSVDERIYLFEHEDALTKDAIRRVFANEVIRDSKDADVLRITLKFTSKWTIMGNDEDEKVVEDPYKPHKKADETQKYLKTDWNNIANDICQVISDMFGGRILNTKNSDCSYRYDPNTWKCSTTTTYKNKK